MDSLYVDLAARTRTQSYHGTLGGRGAAAHARVRVSLRGAGRCVLSTQRCARAHAPCIPGSPRSACAAPPWAEAPTRTGRRAGPRALPAGPGGAASVLVS